MARVQRSPMAAFGVACVAVLLILTQTISHDVPLGTVLYGVIYGSLNGVLAFGLVLTFRVTRAINFAYGAMGGLPAGLAASLYLSHHWPWGVALVFALVLGAVVGLGVGALINWRFARSPRLVLTVASVGLAQLLGGIAFEAPHYIHGPALIPGFKTGLSSFHFHDQPALFNGNDLLALAAVPVVVIFVSWFLLGPTPAGPCAPSPTTPIGPACWASRPAAFCCWSGSSAA